MRTLILIALCCLGEATLAQTPVNKTYPVQAGQSIKFHFDYPDLIKVSTWDKNEISIQGTVSINGGESDDAFELSSSAFGNTLLIESRIKNLKNLPRRITVTKDGKKFTFKNKSELKDFDPQNRNNYKCYSEGVNMDILLEIKVPKNTITKVESVYGMVEIKEFDAPLVVDATYGGVDASLLENKVGDLKAETNYGQIYSNLDHKFSGREEEDFHTLVSAKLGNGPSYIFESKYGNVYLRKLSQ
jgi:hypothetical protein